MNIRSKAIAMVLATFFVFIAMLGRAGSSSLYQDTAVQAKSVHPANCLYAWPVTHALEGSLIGFYATADSEQLNNQAHPPSSFDRGFIFLLLDHPISTCAAPKVDTSAYVNVTRIGLGVWMANDYKRIMTNVRDHKVRIIGNFLAAGVAGGNEPGALSFGDIKQFCILRKINDKSSFDRCFPGDTWAQKITRRGRD